MSFFSRLATAVATEPRACSKYPSYLAELPVLRFEFERIDLASNSLPTNQPVASESERARDQCQSTAVTPPVNLSFSFLSPDIKLTLLHRHLTVRIVVSAVAVFRLHG